MERRLLAMSEPFPEDTPADTPGAGAASLMGARARSLYRGFLHAASGPSAPTMVATLRPLVELALLMKWFSLDPDLHGELWHAQSNAADLRVIDESREYLGLTNPSALSDEVLAEKRAAKQKLIDEARAALKAAGRQYGDRLMPGVGGMVREIAAADPGHAIAARQAYIVAYRNLSPWVHSEASSFKSTTEPISETRVRYVGDRVPLSPLTHRILAAAMMAYCIEVVSDLMRRPDRTAEARAIRDELVDADAYLARLSRAAEAGEPGT